MCGCVFVDGSLSGCEGLSRESKRKTSTSPNILPSPPPSHKTKKRKGYSAHYTKRTPRKKEAKVISAHQRKNPSQKKERTDRKRQGYSDPLKQGHVLLVCPFSPHQKKREQQKQSDPLKEERMLLFLAGKPQWMVYRGHSISQSLPIAPASLVTWLWLKKTVPKMEPWLLFNFEPQPPLCMSQAPALRQMRPREPGAAAHRPLLSRGRRRAPHLARRSLRSE